jgi:hypothetical protein
MLVAHPQVVQAVVVVGLLVLVVCPPLGLDWLLALLVHP